MPEHHDIATILAAADTASQVVEGVDLLLHPDDGSVLRARVLGTEAPVVAGRLGRGDRVYAHVRRSAPDEEVAILNLPDAGCPGPSPATSPRANYSTA